MLGHRKPKEMNSPSDKATTMLPGNERMLSGGALSGVIVETDTACSALSFLDREGSCALCHIPQSEGGADFGKAAVPEIDRLADQRQPWIVLGRDDHDGWNDGPGACASGRGRLCVTHRRGNGRQTEEEPGEEKMPPCHSIASSACTNNCTTVRPSALAVW